MRKSTREQLIELDHSQGRVNSFERQLDNIVDSVHMMGALLAIDSDLNPSKEQIGVVKLAVADLYKTYMELEKRLEQKGKM